MPSKIPPVVFRPSADILAKLRKSALKNKRSVSAEIIARLLQTFKGEKKC